MTIMLCFRRSSAGASSCVRLAVTWASAFFLTFRTYCEAQPTVPTSAPAVPTFTSSPTRSVGPSFGELDCSFQGDPVSLSDTISFQHILNPVDNTLTVEVTYQGTGWVGFGVSADGQMPGSEVIIARTDEAQSSSNPGKYSITARQQDAITLSGQQTLVNASFEQDGGTTVLRFTKAVAESGELPIFTDSSNTFVYAAGSSNTFGYHAQRGSFTIPSLTRCLEPGPPTAIPTAAAPTAAAPSIPTAPSSPTGSDPSCTEERNAFNRCVNSTGDLSGCGACLERYVGASTAYMCDEALAEICGIETACPDCGACESESLAILNCANEGLCDTALECPPTIPTAPGMVPAFTYDCPDEFSGLVRCLLNGGLDAEACFSCYLPYEFTITNGTTCGELTTSICDFIDVCVETEVCGGCWPSIEKYEACHWGSACFDACPSRPPSAAAPFFPTSSSAPAPAPVGASPSTVSLPAAPSPPVGGSSTTTTPTSLPGGSATSSAAEQRHGATVLPAAVTGTVVAAAALGLLL